MSDNPDEFLMDLCFEIPETVSQLGITDVTGGRAGGGAPESAVEEEAVDREVANLRGSSEVIQEEDSINTKPPVCPVHSSSSGSDAPPGGVSQLALSAGRTPLPASRPSKGAVLFHSAFDLPLRSDLQEDSSRDSAAGDSSSAEWSQLKKANLARVSRSLLGDTKADELSRSCLLKHWKEVIHNRQRANPNWTTQWLESYGDEALYILSDTQLEALLGVPIERLRQKHRKGSLHKKSDKQFRATLQRLVDSKLRHAYLRLRHNNRMGMRRLRGRQKLIRRSLNFKPSHSPLRNAYTPEEAERDSAWNMRDEPVSSAWDLGLESMCHELTWAEIEAEFLVQDPVKDADPQEALANQKHPDDSDGSFSSPNSFASHSLGDRK
ncbi:hypothetical protein VTK56DRAFT_2357 [Thermocarpiscus australiensis]